MSTGRKMEIMFDAVYEKLTGSCYIVFSLDELGDPVAIKVMKDGNVCWTVSKMDLLFDYLTLDMKL